MCSPPLGRTVAGSANLPHEQVALFSSRALVPSIPTHQRTTRREGKNFDEGRGLFQNSIVFRSSPQLTGPINCRTAGLHCSMEPGQHTGLNALTPVIKFLVWRVAKNFFSFTRSASPLEKGDGLLAAFEFIVLQSGGSFCHTLPDLKFICAPEINGLSTTMANFSRESLSACQLQLLVCRRHSHP